jgi:hypothetical protein
MRKPGFATLIFAAILPFSIGGLTYANAAAGGESGESASSPAMVIANHLASVLGLSEVQTAKIRSVLEEEHGKLVAVRDDPTLSADDKLAQLQAIRQKASDDIMSPLAPEQQRKLMEELQSQQPAMPQGQAPRGTQETPLQR